MAIGFTVIFLSTLAKRKISAVNATECRALRTITSVYLWIAYQVLRTFSIITIGFIYPVLRSKRVAPTQSKRDTKQAREWYVHDLQGKA